MLTSLITGDRRDTGPGIQGIEGMWVNVLKYWLPFARSLLIQAQFEDEIHDKRFIQISFKCGMEFVY